MVLQILRRRSLIVTNSKLYIRAGMDVEKYIENAEHKRLYGGDRGRI
jgi:hypothetical protein